MKEVKVEVKGRLYKKIFPEEYYFIENEDYPDVDDRSVGELAKRLGYNVGDMVEFEIFAKKKKN